MRLTLQEIETAANLQVCRAVLVKRRLKTVFPINRSSIKQNALYLFNFPQMKCHSQWTTIIQTARRLVLLSFSLTFLPLTSLTTNSVPALQKPFVVLYLCLCGCVFDSHSVCYLVAHGSIKTISNSWLLLWLRQIEAYNINRWFWKVDSGIAYCREGAKIRLSSPPPQTHIPNIRRWKSIYNRWQFFSDRFLSVFLM